MYQHKIEQVGNRSGMRQISTGILLLFGALTLTACGGGASNTENPNVSSTGVSAANIASNTPPPYTGPAPSNQDTLYFYKFLWNNLRTQSHCASCHDVGGQGKAYFANNSNVNDAYAVVTNSAKPLVDLNNPSSSLMVTKFSQSGHYCLDGSNAVCAQELTNWITAWRDAKNGGGSTSITLTRPQIHAPTAPLNFPSTAPSSYNAVYNLVHQHCSGCHVPNPTLNATPVSPEFATDSESDSYSLASSIPLINLADPTKSRFYTRLAVDGHNCWTDCPTAATQMLNAIKQFTDPIQQAAASAPSATSLYLASDAVNLFQDGIVASGGGRYEADQIAKYDFKVGSGNTILDVSGVAPAMNLTLAGTEGVDYKWMTNWGIEFDTDNAKAQALTSDSVKLQQMIGQNNLGYSIEAWVVPANTAQMDSDIVTYTGGSTVGNNFSLGQNAMSYEAFNRDLVNDPTGDTKPIDSTGLSASLQHVVLTNDPINGTKVYVNDVLEKTDTSTIGENLTNWSSSFAMVLGNNPSRNRAWRGQIRMLSIHNAPLTAAEVDQNYKAGVGQKYFLMFNISRYLGAECNPSTGPSCYILMQAAIFDNSSYVFSNPRFINLNDPNVSTEPAVYLKGMRIGINGNNTANNQVFAGMDVCINGPCSQGTGKTLDVTYTKGISPSDGAPLYDTSTNPNQGTIIAMQNGPKANGGLAADMIFLTFEQINGQFPNQPYVENSRLTPAIPAVNPVASDDVLVHSFEEINATLSALTGVPRTVDAINFDNNNPLDCSSPPCSTPDGAYTTAIQALPSTHDAGTFNAANQMAITQLAIAYCNALVNDTTRANQMFPGINFTSSPALNFKDSSSPDLNLVIEPLLSKVMTFEYTNHTPTSTLSTMPLESTVHTDLANLMNTLAALPPKNASVSACNPTCTTARTLDIIKATCATAVASAPMLLH